MEIEFQRINVLEQKFNKKKNLWLVHFKAVQKQSFIRILWINMEMKVLWLINEWYCLGDIQERVSNINHKFMFSLFSNVCRSLFEKHKLHFAFLVCARIRMNDELIDAIEWRHLLSGPVPLTVRIIMSLMNYESEI